MQMASLQEKVEQEEESPLPEELISHYSVREGANKAMKTFKVISKILTSF